jgi:signal transduction histidine kinase
LPPSSRFESVRRRARTEELEARNAENLEQADQLRDLSVRLLKAQDDERRRLARELHDSSGQVLSVLSMNLAILARNSSKNGHETKNAELIRESLELVRQISQDSAPPRTCFTRQCSTKRV